MLLIICCLHRATQLFHPRAQVPRTLRKLALCRRTRALRDPIFDCEFARFSATRAAPMKATREQLHRVPVMPVILEQESGYRDERVKRHAGVPRELPATRRRSQHFVVTQTTTYCRTVLRQDGRRGTTEFTTRGARKQNPNGEKAVGCTSHAVEEIDLLAPI